MGRIALELKEIMDQDLGLTLIMDQKLPVIASWRFGHWKDNTDEVRKKLEKKLESLVKEFGTEKEDGSWVVTTNMQAYLDAVKSLYKEEREIEIPEIQVHLIKDVPLTVRFTTLMGKHLIDDIKYKTTQYSGLTNQQIHDFDHGLSTIMDDLMPMRLAMKLGEIKRRAEVITKECQDLQDSLTKEHGVLNKEYQYEVVDADKIKICEDKIKEWGESVRKEVFEIPSLYLSDFETHIMVGGKKKQLEFPLKFFALASRFIKEKKDEKEEAKTEEQSE